MAVILRIDLDNPYGRKSFGKKALNYLRLNWWFPAVRELGYIKFSDELAEDLKSRGIPGTFFFTKFTTPKNLEFYEDYELGLHVVAARNYKEFTEELNKVSRVLRKKIRGFTKHGSGELKLCRTHARDYEPGKYIDWAQRADLEYFLGNGENPEERPFFAGGVLVYPSAFWIDRNRADKYTAEWLAEESRNRDIVALLHPYNWATNAQVRGDYEKIIAKVSSFEELKTSKVSI